MSKFPTIQKVVLSDRQQEYNPKDEITIMLDGNDISLLNGKNSYLRCLVKISGNLPAELDINGGGGHSLLERVDIYTGDGATLLEQLEDLPVFMGVKNYFDKTSGLTNMRNLLEGLPPTSTFSSNYFENDGVGGLVFKEVELLLPLYMSGVLYGDSVFPVIATNGLMIKIQLADAKRALRIIGNSDDEREGFVNPRLLGTGGYTWTAPTITDLPVIKSIAENGQDAVANVTAGEKGIDITAPACFSLATNIGVGAATTTVEVRSVAALAMTGNAGTVLSARLKPNANAPNASAKEFPYFVGMNAYYLDDAGVIVDCGAITAIAKGVGKYTLTFAGFASTAATAAQHQPVWVAISETEANAANLTYVVNDVQLVCSVAQPDPAYFKSLMSRMQGGSGFEMDIKSFNLYRNNLFKGQIKCQELIPTNEFRARALLEAQIVPVENLLTSYYKPTADYLRQYQYNIRNRLIPQLAVPTDNEVLVGTSKWNAEVDAERVKVLEGSKIDVKSEIKPAGHFIFGREVAKMGHSADLNTHEVRLNLDYGVVVGNAGRTFPQNDKLLYTYVHHFRKLIMKPNNVVVSF